MGITTKKSFMTLQKVESNFINGENFKLSWPKHTPNPVYKFTYKPALNSAPNPVPNPAPNPALNSDTVTKLIDTSIKKINIFSRKFTEISAKLLAKILEDLDIKTNVYLRDINNNDIEMCEKDLNLYLFIFCPQFTFGETWKAVKTIT